MAARWEIAQSQLWPCSQPIVNLPYPFSAFQITNDSRDAKKKMSVQYRFGDKKSSKEHLLDKEEGYSR